LLASLTFTRALIGVHVAAVVVAFGGLASYPLLIPLVTRRDPEAVPALLRLIHTLSSRVLAPGIGVVFALGAILAIHLNAWSHFYVTWGVVAMLAIGSLHGALLSPTEQRLIELAEQGQLEGEEYQRQLRRWTVCVALMLALVLATIIVMLSHPGHG
jgi:hypothetical protein